jgi:hypothetical protein
MWRKSSHSGTNGGDCVEVGVWRKASRSTNNGGNCVEVARALSDVLVVRDSKDPDGGRLTVSPRAWETLTRRIKNAESDLI